MMLWLLLAWFQLKVAALIADVASSSCFVRGRVGEEEGEIETKRKPAVFLLDAMFRSPTLWEVV